MEKKEVFTVVGFSKGTTKKGDKFTKVALEFESPFDNYVGLDVQSHFVYDDLNIQLGDTVTADYGCRADGRAYIRNLTPVK